MATKKSRTQFSTDSYEYSFAQDIMSPPPFTYCRGGGWTNYYGLSRTDINAGRYGGSMIGDPDLTNAEYSEWLQGWYRFAADRMEGDIKALREAKKVMDENPVFARMLDLHKRGLL